MRIDDYLSTVFLIKRRTVAKEWASGGRIILNGKKAKPASDVKVGDKILISYGARKVLVEVNDIPTKSVPKNQAEKYYKLIDSSQV